MFPGIYVVLFCVCVSAFVWVFVHKHSNQSLLIHKLLHLTSAMAEVRASSGGIGNRVTKMGVLHGVCLRKLFN